MFYFYSRVHPVLCFTFLRVPIQISPPPCAVRAVPPAAIRIWRKVLFVAAALGGVGIPCILCAPTRRSVHVLSTILFPACPAPRLATPRAQDKLAVFCKPTCKNITACIVFESPSITPRALLGSCALRNVCRDRLHFCFVDGILAGTIRTERHLRLNT